jgi:hypothetical protein
MQKICVVTAGMGSEYEACDRKAKRQPPLQLCRSNFNVCVVKMVDKAESGLVHNGMEAGQNASPTEV